MYAQLNIAARSRYYCCNINATMRSLCTAELHVTANNIKIPGVTQKLFYVEFMTPTTMKRTYAFTPSIEYFCPILTKSRVSL